MPTMLLISWVFYALVAALAAAASNGHRSQSHLGRRLLPQPKQKNGASFPFPTKDPFYRVPADVGKYPLGAILGTRQSNADAFGQFAAEAHQILYRTTDYTGAPDATVATIVIPIAPRPGKPKALAIGSAVDSASIDCSPSFAYANPDKSKNLPLVNIVDSPASTAALFRGWYVVIPDALGSKSSFLNGLTEGRAMLDGIRASRNFAAPLKNADFAMMGYSGGGHTVGWAAQEAASYYPDSPIIGMVTGGMPADTNNTFYTLNGGEYSALGFQGAAAMGHARPDVQAVFDQHITHAGRANFTKMLSGEWCLIQSSRNLSGVPVQTAFTGGDIFQNPVVAKHMEEEKLGKKVNRISSIYYHARNDQIVPWPQMVHYINQQCEQEGARLQLSWATATGHISSGLRFMPAMLNSLVQVLEQGYKVKTCGIDAQSIPPVPEGGPGLTDLIGHGAANSIAYWQNQAKNGLFPL